MDMSPTPDTDPQETQEWLDALEGVLEYEGPQRAHYLLEKLIDKARRSGAYLPYSANTAYINTIPPGQEERSPGNHELEHRIRSYVRWNAMAMVVRANKISSELGGHIASFASAATLYDVGFNHFWHAPSETHGGDLIYAQGHSAPGIYARAFLEGRITEEQLDNFRQEVDGKGLSSYPHPWLMPDFWQFPTVSMGLGPIMAIYQARFMKYLRDRGILDTEGRKVWAFMGDGEMDEPESLGAISLAARERLDNLIFVVNCNLQRLDGPVRGNGKIIQELEADFRGAGWNVIKVIWGCYWDPLLAEGQERPAAEAHGRSGRRRVPDLQVQGWRLRAQALLRQISGAAGDGRQHVRRRHLAPEPRRARSAQGLRSLCGGGEAHGQPTVILAKTIKGYGMGEAGEGQNITHQQKKMGTTSIKAFRDRFNIPIPDDKLEEVPFYKPSEDSPEMLYLQRAREGAWAASLPAAPAQGRAAGGAGARPPSSRC